MTQAEWTPYADGTSGHSGDTSERAEPSRRLAINEARAELERAGLAGLTWRDLVVVMYERHNQVWHHGQASSALSNLHRTGIAARLKQTRERCGIYVLSEFVADRETVAYGRNKPTQTTVTRAQITETVHTWLYEAGSNEDHLVERLVALVGAVDA